MLHRLIGGSVAVIIWAAGSAGFALAGTEAVPPAGGGYVVAQAERRLPPRRSAAGS